MKNFFYQSKTPIVFSRPNMEPYTWQYLTNTSQAMLIIQSLTDFKNYVHLQLSQKGKGSVQIGPDPGHSLFYLHLQFLVVCNS